MFSSKIYQVSSLTFRSLIHFEFIFVCSMRKMFYFHSLYVAVQHSQDHLLKIQSSPLYTFASSVID